MTQEGPGTIGTGAQQKTGESLDHSLADEQADAPLSEAEAKQLTTRIEWKLEAIAGAAESLMPLVVKAYNGQAHKALGFKSWESFVTAKFAGYFTRLADLSFRREVVQELAESGLSTRAIAPVVGASQRTVANDVRAGEQDCSGGSSTATVLDDPPARPITGIDGKEYGRKITPEVAEPPKPRRRPLPEAFHAAVWDIGKRATTLANLQADDRFDRNRESLQHDAAQLAMCVNNLVDLLDDLGIDRDRYGRWSE